MKPSERMSLQSRAMYLVSRAIKGGDLPALDGTIPCVDCGSQATEYEHRDGNNILDGGGRQPSRWRGQAGVASLLLTWWLGVAIAFGSSEWTMWPERQSESPLGGYEQTDSNEGLNDRRARQYASKGADSFLRVYLPLAVLFLALQFVGVWFWERDRYAQWLGMALIIVGALGIGSAFGTWAFGSFWNFWSFWWLW